MSEALIRLQRLGDELGPLREQLVLIGGLLVPLLHDQPSGMRPRTTEDVDTLVPTASALHWNRIEESLRARGFKHAMDARHANRWHSPSRIALDVVPTGDHSATTGSPWEQLAVDTAVTMAVGDMVIRHATAPAMLILKWHAWEDRGEGDWLSSTDIEDICGLLAMRRRLPDEVRTSPMSVRSEVERICVALSSLSVLDDVLSANLNGADDPAAARMAVRRALARIQEREP